MGLKYYVSTCKIYFNSKVFRTVKINVEVNCNFKRLESISQKQQEFRSKAHISNITDVRSFLIIEQNLPGVTSDPFPKPKRAYFP